MLDKTIAAVAVSAIAFLVVYAATPPLIRALERRKLVVKDYNRVGGGKRGASRGSGHPCRNTCLRACPVRSLLLACRSCNNPYNLTLLPRGACRRQEGAGGWFKPLALAASAAPILLLGYFWPHLVYDTQLGFPLFGHVTIPLLYMGLVIVMIPITGNTINSIDVLNGVASGFMMIASFALSLCLFIVHNYDIAMASLPLGFVSAAFYRYHKFPSRIFPGDSGALTLGAMYGTIAIVGHVEIVAAIALLPAVINSFLFLSSVKRVIEHRQLKANPVEHTDDFKLKATADRDAPVTLVRLIVANKPMTEKEVGFCYLQARAFSLRRLQ